MYSGTYKTYDVDVVRYYFTCILNCSYAEIYRVIDVKTCLFIASQYKNIFLYRNLNSF